MECPLLRNVSEIQSGWHHSFAILPNRLLLGWSAGYAPKVFCQGNAAEPTVASFQSDVQTVACVAGFEHESAVMLTNHTMVFYSNRNTSEVTYFKVPMEYIGNYQVVELQYGKSDKIYVTLQFKGKFLLRLHEKLKNHNFTDVALVFNN